MAYETLIVEIEDYVSVIRLTRPEAMNALNSTLMRELAAAVTAAEANDRVRCIVITGSEKAFAAGADVKEMAEKGFIDVYFDDLFGPEAQVIARGSRDRRAAATGPGAGVRRRAGSALLPRQVRGRPVGHERNRPR